MYVLSVLGRFNYVYFSGSVDELRKKAFAELAKDYDVYRYILYKCGDIEGITRLTDLDIVEDVRREQVINKINFTSLHEMFQDGNVVKLVYGKENITLELINDSTISVKVMEDKNSMPKECCIFTDKNCDGDLYKHVLNLYYEIY